MSPPKCSVNQAMDAFAGQRPRPLIVPIAMLRAAIHVGEKVIAMRRSSIGVMALLCLNLVLTSASATADVAFADPAFQTHWNTDETAAPGFWGQPITGGLFEPYASAA